MLLSASCVISSGFVPTVQAEENETPISEDGLRGYWDFEGEDPMVNKGSDDSLTGVLSGSAVSVKESADEEMGSVLHFDPRNGESARMQIASALNSGGEDFSISLWVNNSSQQTASAKTIILQQSGNGRTLLYRQNAQYVTYISAADVMMGTSTGSDVWEHLVLVRTGEPSSYQLTLYVNGEKTSEKDLTAGAVDEVTDLIIGAHKNAGDTGQFVGDIDELRLYDRAVTEDEVTALFEEHSAVLGGDDTISEDGLTGYWNFDDSEDAMKNGAADSDLTGSLSGDAVSVTQSDAEEMGGVLHFDERGAANSEMRIQNAINSGNDFAVSLWVNNSSLQDPSLNTVLLQQSGNGRSLLFRNNGQYTTFISAANASLGTSTGSDLWEHLVLVKTGNSTPYNITLYVNGEKAGEQNLSGERLDEVTDLIIGAHKNASDTGQFVGDIDEIRLYSRAVTEKEVAALFAEHSSVVLEQLISDAQEVYDQNLLEEDEPEAGVLRDAISQAQEAAASSDSEAVKEAMSVLKEAVSAYISASLILTIDTENVSRTVGDGIFGINHRYAFNGYGSFDPETMQMREEFAELYNEAGFGSLRYPGGTISNLFNWKDTIGPKEDRVNQIHGYYNNSGQHGIEPNFGLDEVAEFVAEQDSELVYVYALARGDADDAADLIEYLNAEVGSNPNGGTAWAEVRAANGHEEPYNVRYFEIGNEMNLGGTDGTTSQMYWIDDVPGGALEGYINGGTASFTNQYVVARDDWNETTSYSDGTADQVFYLRYARVERDQEADDYDTFTAVNKGVTITVGGTTWTEVEDLEAAGPDDTVFQVDYKTGAIHFGDGVHGAVPGTGQQIRAGYSVERDGFAAISEAMRSTIDQINEYNSANGLNEKEIYIYSSYETVNFVNTMHQDGYDDLYDGLTIHPYSGTPAGGSSTEETKESFYYDAMRRGDNQAAEVADYVELMQQYDSTKVPVISEYGIYYSTDTMVRSQTHALYIARQIMEYVRLGSPYIQKHCLVDWYSDGADSLGPTQQAVIQAVSVGGSTADGTGEFRFFSTPSARVFEMLNSAFGDQIIDSSFNYEQQLDNGVDQYSVMTSKDEEGNVYIAVVNLNLEGENKIKIQVDDLDLTGKTMEIQQLSGDTFYAENSLDNPDNVDVERRTETAESEKASVTLAPHSFTVVKIVDALSTGEPEEPEDPETALRTDVLEFTLELADSKSTEGVIPSVAEAFEQAKADARAVLDAVAAGEDFVTQEQIDECWHRLIECMQYLSFQQGDKTDLEKVIAFAAQSEAKLDSYAETGKAEFIEALESARTVYDDPDAMQKEVDSAWMTLLEKTADLRLKADKSALEELISETESVDLSVYTEESAQAFRAALANAQSVLDDDTLTEDDQNVVDEAAAQFAAAKNALVAKDDVEGSSGSADPAETEDPSETEKSDEADKIAAAGETSGSADEQKSTDGNAQNSGRDQTASAAGKSVPVTGDVSVWPVFMVLCLISGAGAVYLIRRRGENN